MLPLPYRHLDGPESGGSGAADTTHRQEFHGATPQPPVDHRRETRDRQVRLGGGNRHHSHFVDVRSAFLQGGLDRTRCDLFVQHREMAALGEGVVAGPDTVRSQHSTTESFRALAQSAKS